MLLNNAIFVPEALARLKTRVEEAEKKTSGEIVPLIVPRSMGLNPVRATVILICTLFGWVCVIAENLVSPFALPASWVMWTLTLSMFVGFVLSLVPQVLRFVQGPFRLARRTHEAALAAFVREGVSATEERSGVLIFVSLFEKRVEIIADRGIHEKVGAEVWKRISDEIALGFKDHEPLKALENAIDRVGELLATHFPISASDRNELSDDVRMRE